MGPWNHAPDYPSEAVLVQTNEDTDVAILPSIPDEDGDLITATVKVVPQHGTVSGPADAPRYMPAKDFYGEDSVILTCSDGYGGTGDLTVNITVVPMNDSSLVVDANGNEKGQVRLQVLPGQSYSLSEMLVGLALSDPDGSTQIDNAEITILAESEDLNRVGADRSRAGALVVTPAVSSETQFLSVAFQDEDGRPSTPLLLAFVSPDDSDSDGIADVWEMSEFGDLETATSTSDYDGDGLLDVDEYALSTLPKNADSDGDGMKDGWEVAHSLNPLVDDAGGDADGDGATNLEEFQGNTNPNDVNDYPGAGRAVNIVPALNLVLD